MHPLEAGEPRTIGAYRLLGRLGAGGMGRVYLGRSAGGRTVAVKIVHPHFASDEEFRARFRREVEAARRVGGEWTAPVLDADPDAPVPWVATGYVAGPSLDRAVASHGPLPEGSVRAVGAGLARALVAVHGLGLVHRDVKPSNVMLTLDGPRLIDFGIARATDGTASLTSTGVSVGSPGYMSPEQILGKGITGAADVFSLGAVLAFAATGRPPFTGDNSATLLYKVVHEPPELGAIPPGELRELIAACLAKTAADRPAPQALADALGGALAAPGWLPAPLVEEASRAAVALLDLEAGPAGDLVGAADPWPVAAGGTPESPSGPVPFTAPSYGSPVVGGFGPADASYGGGGGGAGPYGSPTETAGGAAGAGGAVPQPRTASDSPGSPAGRAVTVRAAGRRFSCTLVLATAAVLAGLSGGLYGMGMLPGQRDERSSAADAGPKPSASAPATGASRSAQPSKGARNDVPKELTGTWKGTVTTARMGVSSEFEITIKAGKVGEVVARDKSVLPILGTDCSGDWKLASATDRSLVLDTAGGPNPAPGVCSNGSADERFTLNENGTLHYKSGDGPAGNPEGDLTRSP
ncbi:MULTISPECIES: serine/threonine-protein kinase [unclassified Streptomyces]|uniref:serine/threonine-protein kinase n=1 Tax=unclassified Streptomyces TaxID=2593676 RepID=UPI0022557697|nr:MULTISPECIES: serine/threonine-protein kinase [unclassified Streptomyces]MCX4527431.1 protein kinase [Streptomyces sp. NBC_01551]MCX4541988.1 protein kinase [Streptomyces sp. NBC_01565]